MNRLFFALFIIIFFGASEQLCAQSANVQSANNYIRYKEWVKAKQYIDLAAANEQTANDPKMWYYRGEIYFAIYRDTTEVGRSEPDAIEKAATSFMNCIKTDKRKDFNDDAYSQVWGTGYGLFKKAGEAYKNGDYERANRFYTMIFDIFPLDKDNNLKRSNVTPETVEKNLYFVALKTGDKAKAKGYLQKLLDVKYNDPMIYFYMDQIYLEDHDTTNAIAILEKGRDLFEDNMNLINEQIRIYVAQGRTKALIDKITATIEGGLETEFLYLLRGSLYQEIKDYDKAAEDYKKAIEIRPDYLDANYRLGAMYFNQAGAMANEASNITATDKFNKAKAEYEQKFKDAQPYLEKAFEINPRKTESDQLLYQGTIISLRQLYARTNQMDKYDHLKAEAEKK